MWNETEGGPWASWKLSDLVINYTSQNKISALSIVIANENIIIFKLCTSALERAFLFEFLANNEPEATLKI